MKNNGPHRALENVLANSRKDVDIGSGSDAEYFGHHSTSLSLARALAVGSLSRLDQNMSSIKIWDPAVGSGFAASMLAGALRDTGTEVIIRGQDINEQAVLASRGRFAAFPDAEIAHGDSLTYDAHSDFVADLVIVDAPWNMDWKSSGHAVETRRGAGSFEFGLPQSSDSTWLFISLALEKLRPAADGGGRVSALVNPGALWQSGSTGDVRERILEAGLLESVTRLPDGLALTTSIPLYLVTFTNKPTDARRGKAIVADLQTEFTTERRHRSMPIAALRDLESGLRTGKPGPRNRTISVRKFIQRDAQLARTTGEGRKLSWSITTYNDTRIDASFLAERYGENSGVTIDREPRELVNLDPSRIFGDDASGLIKGIEVHGWGVRRLSSLLTREPESLKGTMSEGGDSNSQELPVQMYVPTTREGTVATEAAATGSEGRVLSVRVDERAIDPSFLTAWLNSEQGVSSRRRAIKAASTGTALNAVRSDPRSLMRWADELIVPMPDRSIQRALASADERLASFEAELTARRESVWASPDIAEEVVNRLAAAFDDSLTAWLDHLPFPIAAALWTAQTSSTPSQQQRAYIHAWEAIVTFHATVLLAVNRSDPGSSIEVEAAIRDLLEEQNLGIERASFGTWVIIIERVSKELRRTLEHGDEDEIARVRRAFGDLSATGIDRLISKDLVKKFKEVNGKRNRWLGHGGYTSDGELETQVISLESDLSALRQLLGSVWTQLLLVRAGSSKLRRDGRIQTAEVAVGTRSPFKTGTFHVGDEMIDGDLYLVRDGSQSPLRLGQFVQLRAAPRDAQYTTYFYNRTEGASVRMVSYQHGPESEIRDDADGFRSTFGALAQG